MALTLKIQGQDMKRVSSRDTGFLRLKDLKKIYLLFNIGIHEKNSWVARKLQKFKMVPSGGLFEKSTPKRFELETLTFVLAPADCLAAARYQIDCQTCTFLHACFPYQSMYYNVSLDVSMLMDRGPSAETFHNKQSVTTKTYCKWLRQQPTTPPPHTTRLAPLDVTKWSGVPPRMTFPVNGRPPPLQYEYQSIILYVQCTLWCTSVDVWLPLLFHRRLPVTNWEERDSANFNMYLCPCLSVFAFLCVYLSKYNWIGKR